jgi:lipoprotein-anchoring transpeptidase ErfK/SrfK
MNPRHHPRNRLQALAALAGLLCACALGLAPGVAAASGAVPATQQLAVLESAHPVYSEPRAGSALINNVPARAPLTGEATTLPVLGTLSGSASSAWLRVMLPGRPNSSTGWIAQKGTRSAVTHWRIKLDLARRRVTVYFRGQRAKVFQAVVGKPTTPTPTGTFFVEETLQMRAGEPGGPFALALSARSDAFQEFEGGPGQIALHGRDNLGGVLGQAESHGCVRLATSSIDWLAARIGPGVPVTIARG